MRKTILLVIIALFSISVYGQSGPGPSPQTASGVIRYTAAPFTCDSTKKGRVYFNTSGNTLNWCDGTAWRSALSTAMGITGSGTTGQLAKWTSSSAIGNATAGTDYETPANKDAANGYAGLDASTLLKGAEFPTFTGDATKPSGSLVTTVAKVNGNTPGGTCTNQFASAIDTSGRPTCTTVTLAGAQFANQGTTTTVLHGNAAGNPSWGQVVNADIANSTIDLTAKVTGALAATNGGTGQSTYTKGDVLASPGSNTLNKLAVGTDGLVLTADTASTNGIKWAAASGGTSKAILGIGGGGASLSAVGGVVYTAPYDSDLSIGSPASEEYFVSFVIPYNGTLKNLFLRTANAASGGTTVTATVRKNEADTTITATLSASASTTSSDTTHTVSVSQGDRITISLTPVGGVTSAGIASISIEYDSP